MAEIIWYETKMTSNIAPAPLVASASSIFSSTYDAWVAFDSTNEDNFSWVTIDGISTGWIQIDFGSKKILSNIEISSRNFLSNISLSTSQAPKHFEILGSNDNSSFVKLGEYTNETNWGNNETRRYDFTTGNFRYYRINIISTNGATTVAIGKILYGFQDRRKAIVKNSATNQHYSLAEKTLINIPSASAKNMILHGVEAGREIQLDVDFDKVKFIQDASQTLGVGKTFTHKLDLDKYKGRSIKL